jgi:trigger factor
MKIKIKRISGVESDLEVYLSSKEIEPLKKRLELDWQSKAAIPGYRKGKAPLGMVLAKYSSDIDKDLKEGLVSSFYKKALSASKLEPISVPVFLGLKQDRKGDYSFTLKIEEAPKVKLARYRDLKLEKKEAAVEKGDVAKVLDDIKRERTQWLDVQRASSLEDILIVDLEIKPKDGLLERKEDFSLYLSKESIFPELLNSLLGLNIGDVKESLLDVPDDYRDKKIAGKSCNFKVSVKAVKEKKEPEIDDAFAKEFGGHKSVEDLKNFIEEELKKNRLRETEADLENSLISNLIQNSRIELPPQLLNRQIHLAAEDITMRLLYRGFPKKDIDSQKETIFKEAEREAERELKTFFILKEIAQKEGIAVSGQELEEHLKILAGSQNSNYEELLGKLKKEDRLENIKAGLLRKKVIEFLKQHADITIVKNGGG